MEKNKNYIYFKSEIYPNEEINIFSKENKVNNYFQEKNIIESKNIFQKDYLNKGIYNSSKNKEIIFSSIDDIQKKNKYIDEEFGKKGKIVDEDSLAGAFQDKKPVEPDVLIQDPTPQVIPVEPLTVQAQQTEPGFLSSDLYADHQNRLTAVQIKQASILAHFLNNSSEAQVALPEGIKPFTDSQIHSLQTQISAGVTLLVKELSSLESLTSEEREAIIGESSSLHITPLENFLTQAASRLIVQTASVEGVDLQDVVSAYAKDDALLQLIQQGVKAYLTTYSADIPLYDKLYEEFDSYRDDQRDPLEVYLGRDGVYAYEGRRAQDVARRRGMPLAERKMYGETKIPMRYLVYPRSYKSLPVEAKRQYLQSRGINPESDPIMFDTGFVGSIPEQILIVLGYSGEELEQRIRLLSSSITHRQVKGVNDSDRSIIVHSIEHNVKMEEPSTGLYKDKEGKIQPVAIPTTPYEQFYYQFVRQAIRRHYWMKERLQAMQDGSSSDIFMAAD